VTSLISIQLDVLLARDGEGRLTTTRDPSARPAPRLFLGRSGEGKVWAVRQDVPAPVRIQLERACAAEPALASPLAKRSPRCREQLRGLLEPVAAEYRGPAFVLPRELPRDQRAREVSREDASDWSDAFPWLAEDFQALAPVVIAFEAGEPAAVCHSPRGRTPVAAEAGVETLARFRGRGLATAAVACWAAALQRSGRLALYSTSWDNAGSQAVARRLGARLYGEDWHLT